MLGGLERGKQLVGWLLDVQQAGFVADLGVAFMDD